MPRAERKWGGIVIGRLHHVVLDCPDPAALAAFYAELLGLPITYADPAGHPFCLIPRPGWAPPIHRGDATDDSSLGRG